MSLQVLSLLSLRINTPAEVLPSGRGFYQLEEEELYFPIEYPNQRVRFFSFLDSETVSLHLDKSGQLIFVELTLPRRRWKYKEHLIAPEKAKPADIRFLDFRKSMTAPEIFCDKTRETLMFRFLKSPSVNNFRLAENLIVQVNEKNNLVALWLSNIVDDIAGREISAWRRTLRGEKLKKIKKAI